jgi:hypothetical protein
MAGMKVLELFQEQVAGDPDYHPNQRQAFAGDPVHPAAFRDTAFAKLLEFLGERSS